MTNTLTAQNPNSHRYGLVSAPPLSRRDAGLTAKNPNSQCYHHDVLQVVGRPSDQSAMRELFGLLSVSIDRLTIQHCAGLGRTYANNFRLGVVETVSTKLAEETRVREEALRTASAESSHALVLVRKADTEVSDWVRHNLHINRGTRSSDRRDDGARASGRTAGEGLDVTRRRQLPNSRLLAAAC